MTKLQRPLTLCFQTSKGGSITEDILNELLKHVKKEDIKCIQLTADEGQITLFDENTRNQLAPKITYAAFKSIPQILAHDKLRSSGTVSMCENIKYKWNANFIDVYKTNITKFKNNIEETICQAEIKSSLLDDILIILLMSLVMH